MVDKTREQAIEKIAKYLHNMYCLPFERMPWSKLANAQHEYWIANAESLLTAFGFKGIFESLGYVQEAEDQSLPKIAKTYDDWSGKSGLAGYGLAQQNMLDAGWVKVKKEYSS